MFDFNGNLERTSISIDELFNGEKYDLWSHQQAHNSNDDGLNSPISNAFSWRLRILQGKKIIQETFSLCNQRKDFDPFVVAME